MGSNYPRVPPQDIFTMPWKRKGGKEILRGCSNLWEVQHAQNCHARDAEPILVLPSPPFSPSHGSRGRGARKRAGPHPSFLPGEEKEDESRAVAGMAERGMPEEGVN